MSSAEDNCRPNAFADRLRHFSLFESPRNPIANRSESIPVSPEAPRRASLSNSANTAEGAEFGLSPRNLRRSRLPSLSGLFQGKTARRAKSVSRQFSSDEMSSDIDASMEETVVESRSPLPRFSHSVERLPRECWKPAPNYAWRRSDGLEFCLIGVSMEQMGDAERQILQKIALTRLQKSSLGCTITRPKECLQSKQKRSYFKRKSFVTTTIGSTTQSSKLPHSEDSKSGTPERSLVFGIPIGECVENDMRLEYQRVSQNRCKSLDTEDNINVEGLTAIDESDLVQKKPLSVEIPTRSLNKSVSPLPLCDKRMSLNIINSSDLSMARGRLFGAASEEFLPGSYESSSNSLNETDEPSGSHSRKGSHEKTLAQVPKFVQDCCDYLSDNGLTTVGLFRITGSCKRCRDLRTQLDRGEPLNSLRDSETVTTHDVATLLKDFFRDLPNPLCTKELYPAYITASKVTDDKRKLEILRYITALLPGANIDTLAVLLRFLRKIADNSGDSLTSEGLKIQGNKMDTYNLATVFGPTILRPSHSKQLNLADTELVVVVVKFMIDNQEQIFHIPRELQNNIYRVIADTDPDLLNNTLEELRSNPLNSSRSGAVGGGGECAVVPQISLSPYQPRHSVSGSFPRPFQLDHTEEERLRLNVEKLRTKSQGKLILAALGMGTSSSSDWPGTPPNSQLEPVDQRL